jgi:tetratricopeptide (TPR) repeat protein
MTTTAYEIAGEITRLRKSGAWQEALVLGEQEILNFPGNMQVSNALAWAIYDSIKNIDEGTLNPQLVSKSVRRVREITSPNIYGDISAYSMTLLKATSALRAKKSSRVALDLLLEADVRQLSVKQSEFNGKTSPSYAARWYSEVSKCYLDLGELEDLEKICSDALRSEVLGTELDRKFFRYRRALSLESSNPHEAIAEMDRFLRVSKDWWAHQIKARILGKIGKTEESIQSFRTALGKLQSRDYERAVRLLIEFAQVVTDDQTKKDLVQAVRAIRLSKKWNADKDAEEFAKNLGLPEVDKFDFGAVIKKYADPESASTKSKTDRGGGHEKIVLSDASGFVKSILSDNKHGFVTIDGVGDCYLRGVDNPKIAWPPSKKSKVKGTVVESFDTKKNRTSLKFINGCIVSDLAE